MIHLSIQTYKLKNVLKNADVLKKHAKVYETKKKRERDQTAEAKAERAAKIAESKAALMKVNDSDHELSKNHEPETSQI